MNEPERQIMSILGEAVEYRSPEERAAFLEKACVGDADRRARVEALLRAYEAAGNFLQGDPLPRAPVATVDEAGREQSGTVIGPYKLLEQIGEGGMGAVWMAEQQEPVRRTVALKVIKAGLDTVQVVARFEAERQALALMDHPNIAKVLDAGTTDAGRPYFVMELVKGVPITKYCDEHRLTPRQRLELFIPVCRAVQHAHQKGVIHRDLKPSNVLVAAYDGKPVPKVIDFGVAKATGQKLTERTLFTGFGHLVGTLEYMSPEQAEFNALDVDTRSDIYALGVLLYELLTGTTPLTKQRLREAALVEVLRVIREEEPPKPSTRLSASKDSLASVSAQRHMEPAHLTKLVRGELDWIVMKALEKDRACRYDTANGLAQDIERYLRDEPVLAGPPSALYRFRKFARRKKAVLTTAAVVAVAVVLAVAALAVSTIQTSQANRDLHEALDRERDTLDRERRNAYFQRIALAEREWSANNLSRMQQLLAECPEDLRGWEWHYLSRLPHKPLPPLRHESTVLCGVFSPDGKWIASGDQDGWVKVWDAQTGRELLQFRAHQEHAQSVTFSPDGRRLVTGSWDGTVKTWDAQTGNELSPRKLHRGPIWSVAFSPDGRYLISAGAKASEEGVKVWDTATGEEVLALHGLGGAAYCVTFSADGERLAAAGSVPPGSDNDVTLMVWDVRTGQKLRAFGERGKPVWGVAFSPNGTILASCGGSFSTTGTVKLQVREGQTDAKPLTIHGHSALVYGVAFSPDGQRLASASRDQTVKLWDVRTGQEALTLRGHSGDVRGVAFSPDGLRLVSVSQDRTARVWDAPRAGGQRDLGCLTLRAHGGGVHSVAFHPKDGRVLASAGADGTVRLWHVVSGQQLRALNAHRGLVEGLAFSPDGQRLASAGQDRTLRVWDTATGKEVVRSPLATPGGLRAVAFSPDGRLLAAGGFSKHPVILWEVATGTQFRELPNAGVLTGVAFSPDGHWIATAGNDGMVRVWDVKTGHEVVRPALRQGGVATGGVAFSPDGRSLASGSVNRAVKVWDTTTWKPKLVLPDPTGGVWGVTFSPEGKRLAWGGSDGAVRVWDVGREEFHTLRGHTGWVHNVAFSPDGMRIASASADGTVKVWEAPTVHEPARPPD